MNRRRFLVMGGALVAAPWAPARATPDAVAAAIREVTGGATLQQGVVRLDLPMMVENGNAVGMTVGVDEPPSPVRSLHVFADGNPLPNVLHAVFGPAAFRPQVITRIRLASSQTVHAVAVLQDGACWTGSVDLVVTLAACLE
ncbi:MAG: thiosulfate oxidation carrier protein SoxY [Janthinobacterium lividum]